MFVPVYVHKKDAEVKIRRFDLPFLHIFAEKLEKLNREVLNSGNKNDNLFIRGILPQTDACEWVTALTVLSYRQERNSDRGILQNSLFNTRIQRKGEWWQERQSCVLKITSKKRRRNMKLKKILAQTLAAAMVLTSVPVADFTVFAAEDPAAYVSDDAGTAGDTASTADAAEADALQAPQGYKNLQLTVGENVTVTTAASQETGINTNVLTNNTDTYLNITGNDDIGTWINFRFKDPQTVAGLLYYLSGNQANGYVKFAKVEVKTEDSENYQNVYENETAWEKKSVTHAALFTPVSGVTDVKFYGISFNNRDNIKNYMEINKMRIVTVPENAELVTATASTSNEKLGTVTVDVAEAKGKSNTVKVMPGVSVKYQATATKAGEFVEWHDASGKIVSNNAVYTTTAEENTELTAIFRDAYYEKIPQSTLRENAKDNSHANVNTTTTHDLPAEYAFDGDASTLWHQNYGSGAGNQEKPSASNPIWIQTGFGTENDKNKIEPVGCLTYLGRPNGTLQTRISDYVILAACKESGTPEAGDWAVVKAGTMSSNISAENAVETITFTPVNATHIRLVALSAYNSDSFVCAGEINLYRVKDTSAKVSELEDLNTNSGIENGTVTILPPGYKKTDDSDAQAANGESASIIGKKLSGTTRNVTLYAAPNEGYLFDGWKNGENVSSLDPWFMTNTDKCGSYLPNFTLKSESAYTQITITEGRVTANSAMNGKTEGSDGPAWYAFDGNENTHWHSFYVDGANKGYNGTRHGGIPSETNKIYIQAGFGESRKFRKLTYLPRRRPNTDTAWCNAKDYEILVANVTNGEPKDEDFVVVCKGRFDDTYQEQTVILPFAVNATHVRLQVSSVWNHGNDYLAAREITLWAEDATNNASEIMDVASVVSSNDTSLGTVTTDVKKMLSTVDTNVKFTATPASGCHFVKWLITDKNKKVIAEKSTAVLNEVVNSLNQYSYEALFAKDAEVSVSLDQTYITMTEGTSATLTATVKNGTASAITWSVAPKNIATVANGVITAVRAGEATITARSTEDTTKSATCTVVVNAAPSTDTLQKLIQEGLEKVDEDNQANPHYSKASLTKLMEAIQTAQKLTSSTNPDPEAIATKEAELRTALNDLVRLYKITIKSGEGNLSNLSLIAVNGNGEYESSDAAEQVIYVPMFSRVKVTAPGTANQKKFANWQIPVENSPLGKVMCTTTSYTFYVVEDMTLEASYVESEPEVNIFCAGRYLTSLGKISFVAKRSVDKSYRVKEHGIIITDETGWTTLYESNTNAMVKGATRTKKSVAKGTANNGTYEARLKAGRREKWYGRSYVTYTDGNTTYTVYSKVAEYEY